MITVKNYKEKAKDIDFSKLPEALQKSHKNFDIMINHYNTNDSIKKVIDLYLEKLNEALKVSGTKKETKKPEKTNASKKTKTKKVEKKPTLKALEVKKFNDGFEWLILDYRTAKQVFEKGDIEVFLVDLEEQTEHTTEYIEDLNEEFDLAVEYKEAKKHYKIEFKTEKKKTSKPKNQTKNKPQPKKVENIGIDIKFIKRYTLLHNKTKTKKQILTLLASLQNAILKKQIRKTSPFAKEIEHIQDELIDLLGFYGKSEDSVIQIEIDNKTLEKYKLIANSEKVMPAIRYITRYNRLQGKKDVKRKAEKLLKDITNALKKDKIHYYKNKIKEVQKSLKEYVCNDIEILEIEEAELNGVKKKTKIIKSNKQQTPVISSTEFAQVKFTPLHFTGKWAKLIGYPAKPFLMMSYSLPGQGKTSLNIQFAAYLAKTLNKKVLYISDEEKKGYTLQEKIKRFNAIDKNLFLSDKLLKDYKDYDFVIFDSVNSLKLTPDDLKEINKKNHLTSFIYIFQTTKDGKFRGSQEFEHDVDVSIELHNGIATTKKSRFGGNGQIKIY